MRSGGITFHDLGYFYRTNVHYLQVIILLDYPGHPAMVELLEENY